MNKTDKRTNVAVIGGGFSGAMVVAQIVKQCEGSITIDWFDTKDTNGCGIAYATDDVAHLLNVPACRMSAFPDKKEDLLEWLESRDGRKATDAVCPGQSFGPDSFVPRKLYGVYVQHIVRQALRQAEKKYIDIRQINARVVNAETDDDESIILTVQQDGINHRVEAETVVLATGNLPPRRFNFQTGMIGTKTGYVEHVWQTQPDHLFPQRVNELSADDEIVIIGTGLTMVDTVLTLRSRGYKGTITAISRHGILPTAHAHVKPYPAWSWVSQPESAPRNALGLLIGLRNEIKRAEAEGYDWRSVIDSLRPVTQKLWKQLSLHERRKFMRQLFTLWNVHRHRMAPEIHAQLKSMQQSGSLKVISAAIYYVGTDDDGLTVAYRRRGANRMETIRSPLVINCTGPTHDVASSGHQLLRNMRDNELITVGPLRVGIETALDGSAKGTAQARIFPIGSLLIGELLECTAVPELREQAHRVAESVVQRCQSGVERRKISSLLMSAMI